jgi:isopentenyl-diphosphate delta-isomerase
VIEQVVLVDENDREIGVEDKLRAHVAPRLHRAISVLVCNPRGDLLMQQRAKQKYHSPGLWSNTCCGHPRPGEPTSDAARRRLIEEMGFACDLRPTCVLTYRVDVGAGLFEHEVNHVFVGVFDGTPDPEPSEVSQWKWVDSTTIQQIRHDNPSGLTPWFEVILNGFGQWLAAGVESLPAEIAGAVRAWGQGTFDSGSRQSHTRMTRASADQ